MLAAQVWAAGVRQIPEGILANAAYFPADSALPGWTEEDQRHWYGAPISALMFNDAMVAVQIKPGHFYCDAGATRSCLFCCRGFAAGAKGLHRWLSANGILDSQARLVDGCGLSREDRLSATDLVHMLLRSYQSVGEGSGAMLYLLRVLFGITEVSNMSSRFWSIILQARGTYPRADG